jgi:hypothetical protein
MGGEGQEEKQFEDYSQSLRNNSLHTPLLTQDMAIKGAHKPALVPYLVST